ncbi:8260_t:CDS:2, partial [Funneliformis caledonium]
MTPEIKCVKPVDDKPKPSEIIESSNKEVKLSPDLPINNESETNNEEASMRTVDLRRLITDTRYEDERYYTFMYQTADSHFLEDRPSFLRRLTIGTARLCTGWQTLISQLAT